MRTGTSRHVFDPEPERTLQKRLRARKLALQKVSTLKQRETLNTKTMGDIPPSRMTMRGYCKRTDNNQISSRWWED
ncbi:hypothetical protein A2U01_0081721, partial [Trifolium medium]|nr:hypothetical protein [Trifolium medium]